MTKQSDSPWYAKTVTDVLESLGASVEGLSEEEVQRRLAKFGQNAIEESPPAGLLIRFVNQFKNLLVMVLIFAALLTAILQHWLDAIVISSVVIINAIIGIVQEGKAEKALASIRHLLAIQASVIRNHKRLSVKGELLVPGDIVILEPGDKVPADLRLIKSHSLHIQESILTGESVPVAKNIAELDRDTSIVDRTCMAFSGTTVTSGQGLGVVVATGVSTEIGKIGGLLSNIEKLTTPLILKMNVLAKWITVLILSLAVALLFIGHYLLDSPFVDVFMAVVGLSVAAIPEGLPAVLTITLAVGVQAMAKRNAVIRVLPAIETLGAVSVICSDKTGTLTRNEMLVRRVQTASNIYEVTGEGYQPYGEVHCDNASSQNTLAQLNDLALVCNLCNDAEIFENKGVWSHHGDPMEAALLSFSSKLLGDKYPATRQQWERTGVVPFDATNQYMATLNVNAGEEARLFVKGAPEKLIAFCNTERMGEHNVPINSQYWSEKAEGMAAEGLRVLGIATRDMPVNQPTIEAGDVKGQLCLLGLVGLMDPPRSGVKEAINQCQSANIQVKMITGDHAITAQAIGRQLGLMNVDTVLTGEQIDALDDDALQACVKHTDIFARTAPQHKLRLVMALQALGLVVIMTGDGVNDAPSLKRADAGVAMGLKGCEAAKDAADVVLADDNFASIVAAVEQGRTVYSNIKKVVSWTLPTNAAEALTIIVALMAGMSYPITPVQILWINMITAISLGIALAFEPPDKDIMKQCPRPRNQPFIQPELMWQITLVGLLFFLAVFSVYHFVISQGSSVELARTQAMNMLVGLEMAYLFFIRRAHSRALTFHKMPPNKAIWIAVVLVIVAQSAICFTPVFQTIFGTASPSWEDVLIVITTSVVMYIVLQGERMLRRAVQRFI